MTAFYEVDFLAPNNADWIEPFVLNDTNDQPVDLSAAKFYMTVQSRDGTSALSLSTDGGTIPISSVPGGFTISVPVAQMRNLAQGNYLHDMLLVKDGVAIRLWYGRLQVVAGI